MAGLRLSGINSGFDTEAMIQQMLSTYQSKIDQQNQKLQKLQWQQEQYRDIISKLSTFKNKYFDILKRDTYLMSPTSFTKFKTNISSKLGKSYTGLKVTVSNSAEIGTHKFSVSQLATAAVTKGAQVASQNFKLDVKKAMADYAPEVVEGEDGEVIEGAEDFEYSFSLDVKVGNVAKTITFNGKDEDELLYSLNEGLKDAFGTTSGGDAFISASMNENGEFVFKTTGNAIATVTERVGDFGMSKPSASVAVDFASALTGTSTVSVSVTDPETGEIINKKVDFETVSDTYFDAREDDEKLNEQFLELKKQAYAKLAKKNINDVTEEMMDKASFKYTSADAAADYNEKIMMKAINNAFGNDFTFTSDGSYIYANDSHGNEVKMTVASLCDATFGLKKGSATSYMDENTKLSDLGIEMNITETETVTKTRKELQIKLDENGEEVTDPETGGRIWEEVEVEYEEEVTTGIGYSITINGKTIEVDPDATVADLMKAVNESDAGVTMTYSKMEGAFTITANDKGNGGDIKIEGDDSVASALGLTESAGAVHTAGTNSVFTIDGVTVEHNDNVYELDGITYDFAEVDPTDGDEFTVGLEKDYDDIKNALKSFVNDYNQLLDDIFGYTRTSRPRDSSTKSYYEPLTDDEKAEMSEKEIEKWEEKAKEGLLYNDSTVNSIMSKLRLVLYNSVTLDDGSTFGLYNMGIKTASYLDDPDGAAYGKLKFDEDAFDAAFDGNIEAIEKLLTDLNTGVMAQVKNVIDSAISDSSTSKGSLVRKAGLTTGTSTKDNTIYNEMQRINQRIEQLQTRYNNKEEYWWNIFTKLETMQAEFSSQQSYLEQFIANGGYLSSY